MVTGVPAAKEESMRPGCVFRCEGPGKGGAPCTLVEVQHPGMTVIAFIVLENIQEQSALGGKMTGDMDFTF